MKKACIWFCLAAMFLSGCGAGPQPLPTVAATLGITDTPEPTAALTPTLTSTPTQVSSPTVQPTLRFGKHQVSTEGGFSFSPPLDYEVSVQGPQVGVFDEAGTILISMFGATSNPQHLTADEIVDEFLAALFKQGNGQYKKENPHPITVDGVEGLAYDLTGDAFESVLEGQAVIIMPSDQQFLFGLGLAKIQQDPQRWENEGSQAFSGLINSVDFAELAQSSVECKISTDANYGYTQENPIQVGGDAFGGPSSEIVYLEHYIGQNGEPVAYLRTGSTPFGDTILDIYQVTAAGKMVTLYLDEYSYSELYAPVGFTCAGAFPLSAP